VGVSVGVWGSSGIRCEEVFDSLRIGEIGEQERASATGPKRSTAYTRTGISQFSLIVFCSLHDWQMLSVGWPCATGWL
jgi:hypothetical protein